MSINEYIYFFTFLYPEYMAPAVKKVQSDPANRIEECLPEIKHRANTLSSKIYRALVEQLLRNLYIHTCSKEDYQNELEIESDKKFEKKV